MTRISYFELRRSLGFYVNKVARGSSPVLVKRRRGKGNVVLMSEQEYGGWQETVYLLSSPENARHLLKSMRQFEAGEVQNRDLIPVP